MNIRTLAVAALITFSAPAVAGNGASVDQAVRVQVGGAGSTAITGKTRTLEGCLYVQLDRPAPGGITLVRMDQVTSLQVRSGTAWVARDLKALLSKEPARCFAEANG